MSDLRARMIKQMQLHRKAPGTQDQYVQAIAGLAAYYKALYQHLCHQPQSSPLSMIGDNPDK
jgi:hypothetical protein